MNKLPKQNKIKKLIGNRKISSIRKTAWGWFSKYIRLRDCIRTTNSKERCVCITCNKTYPFKVINAGHFIPGRNNEVIFDEEQVNGQCPHCNINGGAWSEYLSYMEDRYGKKKVFHMRATHNNIKIYTYDDYKQISKIYREKYRKLLDLDLN